MPPKYETLQTNEHKAIEFGDKQKEWLKTKDLKQTNEKLLGLHKTKDGIAPGNFVGAIWLGDGEDAVPLIVRSKFEQMDYMAMYLACAEDSTVSRHLTKCFSFWPEKPLIQADELHKLSELLIAAFLRELNELCVRRLRRHFQSETANLHGKAKGKILLHRQLKQNLFRGRQDRVFCQYQTIRNDIPENRVLRAALEKSAKFLNAERQKTPEPVLTRWIHASRAALSDVPVAEVKKTHFHRLRTRGAFAHYRKAIELAKFVLLRLGTDPHAGISSDVSTPPFAINSAELFERYAAVELRKQYPKLDAGYEKGNTYGDRREGFNVTVRPDFWVAPSGAEPARIIDAKYKKTKMEGEDKFKPAREDIFQMVAYSRHKKFLEKIHCADDRKMILALVYPDFDQTEPILPLATDNSFYAPLETWLIRCPNINETAKQQAA